MRGSGFGTLFFFKHKTADDVRISDWSSDVCSSDRQSLAVEGEHRDAIGRRVLFTPDHAAVGDSSAALKANGVLGFTNDRAAIYYRRIDSQILDRKSVV